VQKELFIIVVIILLLGIIGAVCFGAYYKIAYVSLSEANKAANGDEFVKLIEGHNDTAVGVHDNTVAAGTELQSAIGRAAELEQRIDRAYGYAKSTDGELIEFRSAMGGAGTSIQSIIRFQQGIIDFVGRIEANNNAIKAELGKCP